MNRTGNIALTLAVLACVTVGALTGSDHLRIVAMGAGAAIVCVWMEVYGSISRNADRAAAEMKRPIYPDGTTIIQTRNGRVVDKIADIASPEPFGAPQQWPITAAPIDGTIIKG